jgi:hypothetical protein
MHPDVTKIEIAAVPFPDLHTEKSWAVDAGMVDLQGNKAITWLPKSKCSPADDPNVFWVPEWLAKKEGLI